MRIRVKLYGWLKVGVDDPDGLIELDLPDGTNIAELIETIRETSPLLDPRACLVIINGKSVPLDRTLEDDEEVILYPTFGGG